MGPLHFMEKLDFLDSDVADKGLDDLQGRLDSYFR